MATKKAAPAAHAAPAVPALPSQASMTRIPGAVFLPEDYSALASAMGLPPGRVAWLHDHETNTLTGFNPATLRV